MVAQGIPGVAQPPGAAPRRRALAADPDRRMRRLHGLRREQQVVEGHMLPRIGGRGLGPQIAEGLQRLVRRRAPAVEVRRVEQVELFPQPADAHAQREPAARKHVGGRQHLRGEQGRAVAEHHDGGQQPDALGGRGEEAHRGHLLQALARVLREPAPVLRVGVGRAGRACDRHMVAQSEIAVAGGFGAPGDPAQRVGPSRRAAQAEVKTELHGVWPPWGGQMLLSVSQARNAVSNAAARSGRRRSGPASWTGSGGGSPPSAASAIQRPSTVPGPMPRPL